MAIDCSEAHETLLEGVPAKLGADFSAIQQLKPFHYIYCEHQDSDKRITLPVQRNL